MKMNNKEMDKVDSSNVDWYVYIDQTIGEKHPIAARALRRIDVGYDPEDHNLVMSLWGYAKGPIERIALMRVDVEKLVSDFSELTGMDIEFI